MNRPIRRLAAVAALMFVALLVLLLAVNRRVSRTNEN